MWLHGDDNKPLNEDLMEQFIYLLWEFWAICGFAPHPDLPMIGTGVTGFIYKFVETSQPPHYTGSPPFTDPGMMTRVPAVVKAKFAELEAAMIAPALLN
jgi:predicted acyltransferase